MQRREAIQVLRKICKYLPDAFINGVSLTPINSLEEEFELRIFTFFDVKGFKVVQSVAQKHGMRVLQEQGSLLIYPAAKQIQIIA